MVGEGQAAARQGGSDSRVGEGNASAELLEEVGPRAGLKAAVVPANNLAWSLCQDEHPGRRVGASYLPVAQPAPELTRLGLLA